jgi:ABC-type glycerol-3-phosphate transport system substrate-binding protein
MRTRLWVVSLTAVLLVAAACTGGGGNEQTSSGGKVALNFWVFKEAQDQFFNTLVSDFEKKYPNIQLNVTAYPEGQYGTKIDTAIAAGDPPDLGLASGTETMRSGVLLPLTDMVNRYHIDLSQFPASIVGSSNQQDAEYGCAYQGTLYCLGSYTGTDQLFYNKDMFDAAGIAPPSPWPGMTVDQFAKDACQLTDKSAGVYGATFGDPVSWMPWEMLVSPDGKTAVGYVNGPTSVHVHDILGAAIRNGCAPSLSNFDPWEQGTDYFAAGKVAMVVTDFQGLKKIEKAGINYGVSAPPAPQGITPWFNVWTDSVAIYKGTDHVQQAEQFIAYLATEGQKLRVTVSGDMPLSTEVAQQMNWADDTPGRQDALQILPHSRPKIFFPGVFWNVYGPIYDAFAEIIGGEKTAQQALDDVAPAIQDNLDHAWERWNQGA